MSVVPTLELLGVDALRDTVTTYRDVVNAHAARINRLNVYPVPDGDTGTNMARTLDAVVAEMDKAPAELAATCDAISYGALMGARGNSGVIVSQILRGIASTLKAADEATGAVVAAALEAATAGGLRRRAHTRRGDDPHRRAGVRRGGPQAPPTPAARSVDVLRAGPRRRQHGPRPTRRTCCRCSRTPASSTPAAPGSCCCSTPPCTSSTAKPLPEPEPETGGGVVGDAFDAVAHRTSGVDGELDVSEQRYEVMFLCHLADANIDALKQGWGQIGDSIVVVGGDGIVELPRAHQRHRRGDRDGARPRRPAVQDPRHRPVRGGRRRARQPRGRARRVDGR